MNTRNKTIRLASLISITLMLASCYTLGKNSEYVAEPKSFLIPVLYVDGLGLPFDGNKQEPPFTKCNWPELYKMFESNGYKLKAASIHTKGHIDQLSNELFSEVNKLFKKDENFHIVAKSMGGLITRRMLQKYHCELGKRVLSVTTIATPHRGSPVADLYCDEKKEGHFGSLQQAIVFKSLHYFSKIKNAIFPDKDPIIESGCEMKLANMCKFNQENPYDPEIPFFSMGFNIQCDNVWCQLGNWILPNYPVNFFSGYLHDEIALQNKGKAVEDMMNDGLVPVSSAKWGTYLGTFEGEHAATTENPGIWKYYPIKLFGYFNPTSPKYHYQYIWKGVFEKVIVNLNHMKNKDNPVKYGKNCPIIDTAFQPCD